MKSLIRKSFVFLSLVLLSQTAIADDLFSEVTITSVFAHQADSASKPSTSSITQGRRITGTSSLIKLLRDAELESKELSSNSVAVSLTAPKTEDGVLNAVLVVHIDEGLVNIGVPLVRIEESKAPARKLLEMMSQGRNNDAIYFVYSPESQWFGARRRLSNQNITSEKLLAELNEMVAFAERNVELWQPLGETLKTVELSEGSVDQAEAKPKATTPEVAEPETQAPQQPASITLTGTWAARGANGEGFGITFDGNNFELAIVNKGKTNQSKGTWTRTGSQLQLAGEGLTLTGTLTVKSNKSFELRLSGQNPLSFTKFK